MAAEALEPESGDAVLEIGGLRIQPGDRVGPYVYRRVIGKGGMAHVVLASDPDGRPVALKVLKSNRVGTGLTRFKREFRALARLRHPNVIRVDAYGDLYGHPYIAMEYVEGHDLHAAIHAFRTVPAEDRWRRCEEILVDLCRALAYIHRRGLVHRDLKPSNVLIDPSRRCKLTDFGIVKDLDPNTDTAVSTTLVGTWAYASPEQITGQPVDHRSDLYSLGVILFAMLTGRRPFVAKDLSGYLELHRTHQAPAPRDVDPSVPAHLDEICRRLLRKQPRERYRSAQEILYRLEQLEPDGESSEIAAWEPPLVGRAQEEELLRARVGALTRGEGGLVLIEGPEGLGKSRLLDVAASQARLMGLPVIRERVAQRDSLLGPLLRLATSLGRDLGTRAPVELATSVNAFSREEGPGVGNAREKLTDALVAAFVAVLEDGPHVLRVDDLHNASGPTLDGLVTVVRRVVVEQQLPLLVVAAVQSDRMSSRMAAVREGAGLGISPERVPVGPLSRAAVEELVTRIVGPGRPSVALADRLFRETEGNPLFLALFLQNLMLHGMLARAAGGWRLSADVEEIQSGHFDVPPGVRQVIKARLAPLTDELRPLVEALAVQGREMELDALLDVLDLDEDAAAERLEALEDMGVVEQRRAGQQVFVDFAHSKFADVTYRDLEPDRRADLHRRSAAAMEVRYVNQPSAAEVVGEHYRRAGEAGKAYQYFVTAARRLADRGLPNEAWELCARAEKVEDAARVEMGPMEFTGVRHQLLTVRADVHFVRSEWAEARETLEDAIALGGTVVEEPAAIRAHIHLARVLRMIGDYARAEEEVDAHLARARALHDREAVAEGLLVLAGVCWSRGQLDACEARAQEGLVLATGAALSGARAQLLLALTAVQAARGQLASAASGLSEAQLLFKDLRMKPARALALSNLAEVLLGQGDPAAAWQHASEALLEAQAAGHRLGECAARTVRGQTALSCGMFELAAEEFEASLALAKAMGVVSETAPAACHLGRLAIESGDAEDALEHLDVALLGLRESDPERYGPEVAALRAEALARTDNAGGARGAIAEAEAALPTLPLFRRAQVTLDLARARAVLGERNAAVPLARAAMHLASMRGFRLLTLDALSLAASLSDDVAERVRLEGELQDWIGELVASVPPTWQVAFRRRFEADG
ncbi:MAG: protein kinase domain-containing protein [Myxococcota bacterium]